MSHLHHHATPVDRSAHRRRRCLVGRRPPGLPFIAAAALAAALSACTSSEPAWLTAPADPAIGLRTTRYTDVTAGVVRFRVVEPKDWRELNRAVGPQGGASSGMEMGTRRETGGR